MLADLFINRGISRNIKACRSLKSESVIFLLGGRWFVWALLPKASDSKDDIFSQDESKELHRKCCSGPVQAVWGSAPFDQGRV